MYNCNIEDERIKKRRLAAVVLGAALLMGTTAFAYGGKSYAEITWSQTGVDGGNITADQGVYIFGHNDGASDHGLWSELYKSVVGPDINKGSVFCWKNENKSANLNVEDGTYYIHLDPDGPNYSGCQGNGYAQD